MYHRHKLLDLISKVMVSLTCLVVLISANFKATSTTQEYNALNYIQVCIYLLRDNKGTSNSRLHNPEPTYFCNRFHSSIRTTFFKFIH
jgi:hypothetical protein